MGPRDNAESSAAVDGFRHGFEIPATALTSSFGLEFAALGRTISARFLLETVRRSLLGGSSSSIVIGLAGPVSSPEERAESSWLDSLSELAEDMPMDVSGGRRTLFLSSDRDGLT